MNATDYVLQLDLDARYRVLFEIDKGKVIQFVVQLEIMTSDKWTPVVRYDTAHRFPHRDRFKADGSVVHDERLPVAEFKDALTYAIKDIRSNWEDWIREHRE